MIPPAPGAAARARADSPPASVPSMAATESSTSAALIVQTSGRNRPVASAKPAIAPLGSADGAAVTA